MSGRARARCTLVVLVALVVQQVVFADFHLFGVMPDVMLLMAVVGGSVGGPILGATIGFGAGLAMDLFVATPFGLSALAYTLAGFGVGAVQSGLLANSRVLRALFVGAGSVFGELLYALVGSIVGQGQMLHVHLIRIMLVVGVVNVVLSIPAYPAMRWALGSSAKGMAESSSWSGSGRGRSGPRLVRRRSPGPGWRGGWS
ncbi:MAG: rod shape-determining protein MreD [Acidimicrobiales bacterium]